MGNVILATPDSQGRIVHVVQAYQNLSRIGEAYGVSVNRLVELNGITVETPLQIGQKLLIKGPDQTPTPTPVPLTPLQKLTPAADGKYYHTVTEGQTLVWIAGLYGISYTDLMAWNYLNASSVIYPGEKLLLQVTPPATATFTPLPPTETPLPTHTATPTMVEMEQAISSPTATISVNPTSVGDEFGSQSVIKWTIIGVITIALAGGVAFLFKSRKSSKEN